MVLQVIVCALAAAGVLLIVWCVVGHLLQPAQQPFISIYLLRAGDERLEQAARAFAWLCESGCMAGTLYVVDCAQDEALSRLAAGVCAQSEYTRVCSPAELTELLKLES